LVSSRAVRRFLPGSTVDLDMRILLVDGDDVISDSSTAGLAAACTAYAQWLDAK